jgi:hypothetical protein
MKFSRASSNFFRVTKCLASQKNNILVFPTGIINTAIYVFVVEMESTW